MALETLSQLVSGMRFNRNDKTQLKALIAAMRSAFLFGSATYDAANLADGAGATGTVTVTGAALGDFVDSISFGVDLQGITCTAYVSAANTVSFRLQNESGGAIDLASTTVRVIVRKKSYFDGTYILGLKA